MITIITLVALLFLFLPLTFVVASITFHAIKQKTVLGSMFMAGFLLILCTMLADIFVRLYNAIFL